MSKRRQRPLADREPRLAMSPAEIASAAYRLALVQAHDDNADVYEVCALLALEALAMLSGRDLDGFGSLLGGLGVYAGMRRVECTHAALAGVPPPPLNKMFDTSRVH